MNDVSRWRDSGHLERAVQAADGQEGFDAAVAAMLDDARGWRLAEMRKQHGMTQEQMATRMGVSVARVSQIESGDVSTRDVLNRFVTSVPPTCAAAATATSSANLKTADVSFPREMAPHEPGPPPRPGGFGR
jgi:DNA-binding XRE family transcriptional regulator